MTRYTGKPTAVRVGIRPSGFHRYSGSQETILKCDITDTNINTDLGSFYLLPCIITWEWSIVWFTTILQQLIEYVHTTRNNAMRHEPWVTCI